MTSPSLSQRYDAIIVGAGAAGLMTAWQAGLRGRRIAVIEHTKKPGKKILMSGGGRCNFTNLDVQPFNYLCNNPHFVKSALTRYTQWDFIGKVLEHGIPYHERKHGELFCDNSAKDILKLLLEECKQVDVEILTQCTVESINAKSDAGFTVNTSQGEFICDSVVGATGGLSIPSMGTTEFSYDLAKQFNMPVTNLCAALVPFTFEGKTLELCKSLAGNAIEISVSCNGQQFTENMLFTHRGLSGPSMLQISSYWRLGETITIDLLPSVDMASWLIEQKTSSPKNRLRTLISQQLPKAFVQLLEKRWWPELADKPMAEFGDGKLKEIGHKFNAWVLYPNGTEGYRTAEVTLGGIDTDYLSSKTMESKTQKGLYFVGECMDVTGHLGGYNFQWAWSSGYAAGQVV